MDEGLYVLDAEEYGWSDDESGSDTSMNTKNIKGHDDGSAMMSESESESELEWATSCKDGWEEIGIWMIYPSLDLDHYSYRHAHIRDFSTRAIANYNLQTGHSYEFVELVDAYVTQDSRTDVVTVIFKASRRDDELSITSFRAQAYAPGRSLPAVSNLDIKVVPLHHDDISTEPSGSDSAPCSHQSQAEKLDARVERLQIST